MDRFEVLRTFVAVVDHKGFAAASRALDVAPPVVTRRVAELEERLGVRLLTRTTRSVSLTTVGQAYLERVRAVLLALDEADLAASLSAREISGTVRLSAPDEFMREVLVPAIGAWRARHPKLQVELLPDENLMQPSAQADLTVILDFGHPLDGDFVARPVAQTRAVICASPAYLAQHKPILHPSDLLDHSVMLPSLSGLRRDFSLERSGGDRERYLYRPTRTPLVSSSGDAMVAAALAGLGVVGSLSFIVHKELAAGRLVQVLPDWQVETWRIYLAYPRADGLTAPARALMEHLSQTLGDGRHDPWLHTAAHMAAGESAR